MPTLLTRSEAAAYLRISLPTLNRLVREGRIKVSKMGRVVRISQDSLAQALESASK